MEIKEVKKETTTQEHHNFYSSWKSILTTTHHTDIGIMYLVFSLYVPSVCGAPHTRGDLETHSTG